MPTISINNVIIILNAEDRTNLKEIKRYFPYASRHQLNWARFQYVENVTWECDQVKFIYSNNNIKGRLSLWETEITLKTINERIARNNVLKSTVFFILIAFFF